MYLLYTSFVLAVDDVAVEGICILAIMVARYLSKMPLKDTQLAKAFLQGKKHRPFSKPMQQSTVKYILHKGKWPTSGSRMTTLGTTALQYCLSRFRSRKLLWQSLIFTVLHHTWGVCEILQFYTHLSRFFTGSINMSMLKTKTNPLICLRLLLLLVVVVCVLCFYRTSNVAHFSNIYD